MITHDVKLCNLKKIALFPSLITVITGCQIVQFTPERVLEKQLVIPEPVTAHTSITATTTGHLHLEGTLMGESCIMDSLTLMNEVRSISHAQSGVEGLISCGDEWVSSKYMALAGFAPHYDGQNKIDGFAIYVNTTAQAGLWFSKQDNDCVKTHPEKALTYVTSTGSLKLNYTANAGIKDQLLININSDTVVTLVVTDGEGNLLPVQNYSTGKMVELPHSGNYEITAKVIGYAVGEGRGETCINRINKTAVITFQSLRDAMMEVGSDSLYKMPLQIFIPATAIQHKLNDRLFVKRHGRYYPCNAAKNCGAYSGKIYFKNPVIKVNGDELNLTLQVKRKSSWFSAHHGIKGSILLTAGLAVNNDVLQLTNVTPELSSGKFLTEQTSHQFVELFIQQLQEAAYYNFFTQLNNIYAEMLFHFPIKWNMVSLSPEFFITNLKQFYPVLQPEPGIAIDYGIKLEVREEAIGTEEEK